MDTKARNRLLSIRPRPHTAAAAAEHCGGDRRGGLVGTHRIDADEAHAEREQALSDVCRQPGMVEVVVRWPPGIGVGGSCGRGCRFGGAGLALVPVPAPAGVEEYRGAGADAMGHKLDVVPDDALAHLLVRDVQDEGGEYECARWELVDGGSVNKKVRRRVDVSASVG